MSDDAHNNVFDVNWSCDGTLIAAGIDKSILLLDIGKVLSDELGPKEE